jgi:hypothetical protein
VQGTSQQAAEKLLAMHSVTSAAKAAGENRLLIAALKRCATQNQASTPTFFGSLLAMPCSVYLFSHQSSVLFRNTNQ